MKDIKEIIEQIKNDVANLHSKTINLDENISLENLKKLKSEILKRFDINLEDEEDKWKDVDAPIPPDDSIQILTGLKRLDSMNIIRKKRQLCFIGKTGEGKTLMMENLASLCAIQKYNVAYISFEVEWGEVQKRIHSHCLSITQEKLLEMDSKTISKMYDDLQIKKPKIFYDPFATYSPSDLRDLILKKEEDMGEKFDIIFIDYLGIVDSPEDDMYQKGKAISASFMRYAKAYNWAIISAAQANRAGMMKIIPGLDDIAESMGINHYFDWMVSILHYDSLRERKLFAISLQKARYVSNNNGIGSINVFNANWDFAGKFTEVTDNENEVYKKMIIRDDAKDPKKRAAEKVDNDVKNINKTITAHQSNITSVDVTDVIKKQSDLLSFDNTNG